MKGKGSIPENIVQGVNCATTDISSMHVNQEADESNGETEYNSDSDNEENDNSEPTPGACFHQVTHHINNDAGRLNPYWILLKNHSTVHMLSNRAFLANIKYADKPINVYLSGGVIHCTTARTLKNIGQVYLHKNGLANILSYAKIKDKHNMTYYDLG